MTVGGREKLARQPTKILSILFIHVNKKPGGLVMMALADKHIVLGVTGSIACYKALDLASKLTQAGAAVDAILSYGATRFVAPLAFRSLTHRPVVTDAYDPAAEFANEHIALAQRADILVIAPATAHCIAKLAAAWPTTP